MTYAGSDRLWVKMQSIPLHENYLCEIETVDGTSIDLFAKYGETLSICDALTCRDIDLDNDGRLRLAAIWSGNKKYIVDPKFAELVTQEFFLSVKHFPTGPKTKIPFYNAEVCTDTEKWEVVGDGLVGQVVKPVPGGLLIRVDDCSAFLPMSLVPESYRSQPSHLRDKVFECRVVAADGVHPPVVESHGPFMAFDEWHRFRG